MIPKIEILVLDTTISTKYIREIQMGFVWCCKYNCIDSVKYIYKFLMPNMNIKMDGFKLACINGNYELCQYLYSYEKDKLESD